jgi:fructokinase
MFLTPRERTEFRYGSRTDCSRYRQYGTMGAGKMTARHRIAGLGEVLWDAFPEGETFGGAPANVACHCRSLGADAFVISCVGQDERGREARRFLDQRGVIVSGVAVSGEHETGVVLVTLDATGKPEYDIRQGVAWDYIPWTDDMEGIAGGLDAVCFGSLCQRNDVSRLTIRKCLDAVMPACLRVFDVNLRQSFYSREVIVSSLAAADVLKLNDEELPVMAALLGLTGTDEEQLRGLIGRYGLKLAALTRGGEGALMMTPAESSSAVPPPTDVINTVGAGDSFTAAMVVGFLRGRPLDEINRHANAVAAYVCTQHGAVPVLPPEVVGG